MHGERLVGSNYRLGESTFITGRRKEEEEENLQQFMPQNCAAGRCRPPHRSCTPNFFAASPGQSNFRPEASCPSLSCSRPAEHDNFLSSCLSLYPRSCIMLSRAVLHLSRPGILASSARISTVQHPRWYSKDAKPKTPYNIPDSIKSSARKPGQSQSPGEQKEYSAEQAEFESNADPQRNTAPRDESVR